MVPDFKYLFNAADAENWATDSIDVYMRMGQEGPRTPLKCRTRGMRLVRNCVSTMTAALVASVPLKLLLSRLILLSVCDADCPLLVADSCGGGALVEINSVCWEYTLRIVLWGKHSLAVQRKRRMRKAERRIFRDLRRRSSIVLINAMVSG